MANMRTSLTRTLTATACVLALGLLTGCGAVETIAKLPGVSADEDGGTVTLNDGDGGSATFDVDASGEIPDWFPAELPLPDEYTVTNVSTFDGDEESMKMMTVSTPLDFDSLIAGFDETLAASAITPELRNVGDLASMKSGMYQIIVGNESWMINILDYGEEDEEIGMSYSTVTE